MTELEKWLATALRAEKAASGMTNAQLSERSGIPEVSVQRYLKGARPITTEILEAFADALDVRASYLVIEAERRQDAATDLDYVARPRDPEPTDEQ